MQKIQEKVTNFKSGSSEKYVTVKAEIFANCRSISDFEKLTLLGEGTFGSVYSAKDKVTNKIVAIKKVLIYQK